MKKYAILTGFVLIMAGGCNSAGKLHQKHFRVQDAFYYTWFAGQEVRGTHIEIHITDYGKDIRYDSLVFRGGAFPLTVKESGKKKMLSAADLISGFDQLGRRVPSDLPDQLIYTYKGKRYVQLLDNFRNDGMKYMKPE